MTHNLDQYLTTLRPAGWTVRTKSGYRLSLPPNVLKRYPNIPKAYLNFLRRVDQCSNKADNAWFLTSEDFGHDENDGTTFHWNEWERMSLAAAEGHDDLLQDIRSFWTFHFPIASAVHSDYAYLALSVGQEDYGAVVYGYGIDFEEAADKIAASLNEYFEAHRRIIAGEVSAEFIGDDGQVLRRREFWDFL